MDEILEAIDAPLLITQGGPHEVDLLLECRDGPLEIFDLTAHHGAAHEGVGRIFAIEGLQHLLLRHRLRTRVLLPQRVHGGVVEGAADAVDVDAGLLWRGQLLRVGGVLRGVGGALREGGDE